MPAAEYPLAELQRAYQVIGVPFSSSALSIKQAYHRLVRRWHPDLYPKGTPAQDEATFMMKVINEAFSKIEHAPLRYHIASYPAAQQRRSQVSSSSETTFTTSTRDTLPVTDRLEFWVRFVCGALLGAFLSLKILIFALLDDPKIFVACAIGLIIACGYGAARYGDEFWSEVLARGWRW